MNNQSKKDSYSEWHLIYTRPNSEKKAFSELHDREIDSFLPTERTLSCRRDRRKYIESPLFPSYVFVRPKNAQEYYDSLALDSVLHYVKIAGKIANVQKSIVDSLKLAMSTRSSIEVTEADFAPGMELIIKDGVLAGISGELVQFNGKRNILLRVELLRRNVLIRLQSDQVMIKPNQEIEV
jgi:transcriptional antiterminator RfaH